MRFVNENYQHSYDIVEEIVTDLPTYRIQELTSNGQPKQAEKYVSVNEMQAFIQRLEKGGWKQLVLG